MTNEKIVNVLGACWLFNLLQVFTEDLFYFTCLLRDLFCSSWNVNFSPKNVYYLNIFRMEVLLFKFWLSFWNLATLLIDWRNKWQPVIFSTILTDLESDCQLQFLKLSKGSLFHLSYGVKQGISYMVPSAENFWTVSNLQVVSFLHVL